MKADENFAMVVKSFVWFSDKVVGLQRESKDIRYCIYFMNNASPFYRGKKRW